MHTEVKALFGRNGWSADGTNSTIEVSGFKPTLKVSGVRTQPGRTRFTNLRLLFHQGSAFQPLETRFAFLINENFIRTTNTGSGVRRKFPWGLGFIQWHMVVISISCLLFVTKQLDSIFMFPNQHYDVVCWHNMHILLHILSLFYVSLHLI